MLKIQKKQCETCIYRKDSPLDLKQLESQIADPKMKGHFIGYRACHHSKDDRVVCRGFWNRHKDDFDLGQLATRLGVVEEVEVDDLEGKG